MGEVEGKVCSQEGQKPPSNECRCQKEVVGVDEGALGSEEKGEDVVQGFTALSGGSSHSCLPSRDNDHLRLRTGAGRYHHMVG